MSNWEKTDRLSNALSKKQLLLLITFLVLTTLAGGLYSLKESDFLSEKVRLLVVKNLTQVSHQSVEIKQAEFTLFPPSVVLREITSPGVSPFSAREVHVYFNLWSFFSRSFLVRKIIVESPTLSISENSFIEEFFQKPSATPRRIRVQINHGTFLYKADDKELALTGLHLKIVPDGLIDRFDITFSTEGGSLVFAKQKKQINRFEGKITTAPKKINLKSIVAKLDETEIEASGTIKRSGPKKSIDTTLLYLKVKSQGPLQEYFPAQPNRPNLAGNLLFTSDIEGTVAHPIVTGALSLSDLTASDTLIGTIHSDFSYKDKTVSLNHISGTVFSGTILGSSTIALAGLYQGRLTYNNLELKAIEAVLSGSKKAPVKDLFVKGQVSFSGHGAKPETITASGSTELYRKGSRPEGEAEDKMSQLIALLQTGQFRWKWDKKEMAFEEGTIAFQDGSGTFHGTASEQKVAIHVELIGHQFEEAAKIIHFPVSGRLSLVGDFTGSALQPVFKGQLVVPEWQLLGHPFGPLQTELFYQNKTLLFQDGSVQSVSQLAQKSLYQFGGIFRFEDGLAYHFKSNIAAIDPQEILRLFKNLSIPLTTTVTGELLIDGIGKQIVVTGPLAMSKGTLYGESFEKGNLILTITEKTTRFDKIALSRAGATAEGAGEISYQGDYTLEAKASSLPIPEIHLIHSRYPELSGEIAITASGKGTIKEPNLKLLGLVRKLKYREVPLDAGTIKMNWEGNRIAIESAFTEKKFFLDGQITTPAPSSFSFQSRFDHLPLPYTPESLALYATGVLSGKGTFAKWKELDLTANLSQFSATLSDYTLVNDGPITFQAQKGIFQIENAALKGPNTHLTFLGGITPLKTWGLAVKGSADLNLLRVFTPKIRSGKGTANLDLRITDQWKDPKMQRSLTLNGGSLSFSNNVVLISSLSLLFNRQFILLEKIAGKIGSGRFTGFGKATLAEFNLAKIGLQFDFVEMPIAITPDLTAVVAGPLLFTGDQKDQMLTGTLHIRKAVYDKRIDLRKKITDWLDREPDRLPIDIPFINSTRLNIHLYGNENIAVNNNVANVPLTIDLDLKGKLNAPLLFGQVNITQGTFYFRSNNFKVKSGTVQFVHPTKIDPIFDIKGQTRIQEYTIDLTVAGRLSQFDLALSSFPVLPDPEVDILSLLTVGKTTADLSAANETSPAFIAGEAATFIVSDLVSSFLAEPIKRFTKFDRISVGA